MHIVVVGAGASGMASAILLAKYGHQVTLCEAGQHIGPLLRGFKRNGYYFDTGLHCVGTLAPGETLWRYLNMLDLLPHLNFIPMQPDSSEIFRFKDSDIYLPSGLSLAFDKLKELWPNYSTKLDSFKSVLEQGFLHSPLTNPLNTSFDFDILSNSDSVLALINSFEFPERLNSILLAHAVFMGTKPRDLALNEFSLVSYSMHQGMHTIRGGGAALVEAFERELATRGVKILTAAIVKRIHLHDGLACAVGLADGTVIDCDAVLYTGHPRLLPDMLPDKALRPAMSAHLAGLEDTGECISLYGSSSSSFADGRFVYLCGSDYIADAFTKSKNEQAWLTVSSGDIREDGRRSVMINMSVPGGFKSALANEAGGVDNSCSPHDAKYSAYSRSVLDDESADFNRPSDAVKGRTRRPNGYSELKKDYESWIIKRFKELCPEMNDFELITSSTDYSMRDWVYGSTGSVYGVLHSLEQMPVLPRTKVSNLVLAGQGVILPGLLGAVVSAAVAVGMLAGFDKIFKDFRHE